MTRDRSWTRRCFLRSVAGGMAGARLALAQVRGDIHIQGQRATFSVESGRLLESVAYTFARQYGWPITFEEALTVYEGDLVDVTLTRPKRPITDGRRLYSLRGGRLEFSYDLGPDGRPPEDPAAVLQTALDAYHRGGFPGRYELRTVGEYFHIVPTARRDEGGNWEPFQSPLDTVVTLDGHGHLPDKVLTELRQRMGQAAGHEISPGFYALIPLEMRHPESRRLRIVERFERVKAREVLRSLIATAGRRCLWALLCGVRQDKHGMKKYGCVLNLSFPSGSTLPAWWLPAPPP